MTTQYDAEYYAKHLGPIPCSHESKEWTNMADKIAQHIARDFAPAKVIDAGCSIGLLVKAVLKLNVEAFGLDGSEYAVDVAHQNGLDEWRVINYPLQQIGSLETAIWKADLVTCIEVLEHIPAEDADLCIRNLCNMSTQWILFSSSPDDIVEPTHVNVQPEEYWLKHFEKYGFIKVGYADYITPWCMILGRIKNV